MKAPAPNPVADAAKECIRRGWSPVPIRPGSKVPSVQEWQKLRLTEADVQTHFRNGNQNIGIALGVPSSGLTDVDLDAREAVALAPYFLPETPMAHGRPSNPGSHRWYQVKGTLKTQQYEDPEGAMLVELRSTGAQTVIPPSAYSKEEMLSWEGPLEPAFVEGEVLDRQVGRLAAATLLVRNWPKKRGNRQGVALALAGGLLHSGWSEEETAHFLGSVVGVARDEESAKRIAAVVATAKKDASGEETTGWPRLAQLLGEDIVDRILRFLGIAVGGRAGSRRASAPDRALKLLTDAGVELFHDSTGCGWALLPVEGHQEVWSLKSREFKSWVTHRYWNKTGRAPAPQTIQTALAVLEAKARFEGREHTLNNRVAVHDNAIWYDLADKEWRAVRITADGWEVVPSTPILFRRRAHQQEQIELARGGDLHQLLQFVNITDPDHQLLLLVAVVACLIPDIPHPILVLHGPQGSSKTTLFRIIRRLVDPSVIETLSFPRDVAEFVQQLSHHWIALYDNLTRLPEVVSDLLCRAVTGEGFSKRELYSDDEDFIYSFRRCVGLNGINVTAQKPDLLDRCILFALDSIPPNRRRPEKEFWAAFEQVRPALLGAMFDALGRAMMLFPTIRFTELPRMADFAQWGCAISVALGHSQEEFLAAYRRNVGIKNEEVVAGNPVAAMVVAFMEDREEWLGEPSELLEQLERLAAERNIRTDRRPWPQAPHALSRGLNEIRTNLETMGIRIQRSRDGRHRHVVLSKVPAQSVTSDTCVSPSIMMTLPGDGTRDIDESPSIEASPASASADGGSAGGDACDAPIQDQEDEGRRR